MQMAAIYARVSSEQQREAHTIGSQTTALIEWAKTLDLEVPTAWIFEDDGYSGATLERPGLERVRDLAAEGQITAVLVYAPDRLSRKYAYQILLIEELARQGVATRFLNAPQSATAEDQLLVQFQGMIAEYERAQILERSRRGKRHRARAGEVSVLSGAPYGYRYLRKREDAPASYAVIDAEARVVREVYAHYTTTGWSIGAIARWLNDQRVATRKPGARWERSMVWAMLRNPAYRGFACFGKTRVAKRQRVTRPLRRRGGITTRDSANHERPREEWIEIPVPPLIAEDTFARAQELLHENQVRARRRTIEPSVVQGLVSCRKCGYALSRTSTRSSARPIHYYRCLGSDGWRHLGGPVCENRPVRQDLLDEIVWREVMRLLEAPALIEQELDRRLAAARAADPTKQREQTMQRELVRVSKGVERLLTAYQEGLVSLEQLRERMPPLRQREQTLRTELHALAEQTRDRASYLRLAETLSAFLARLRLAADTLDVLERQRIVRLVVKEVLVGDDSIVIRHSIPMPSGPPGGSGPPRSGGSDDPKPTEVTFCVRGVISPLLSNIYLHVLDRVWETRCAHVGTLVRYADDFVVMCDTKAHVEEARRRVGLVLTRLGLELHPEKTRTVDLSRGRDGFDFLGCHLRKRMSGPIWERARQRVFYLHRCPSQRAMAPMRTRVRALTPRARCHQDIRGIIADLNPVLRGWGQYFRTGNATTKFIQIDTYVEERLHALLVQRAGCRLRAGRAAGWRRPFFEALGLHRLRGTIQYPGTA